jgi:hypothetical protein
MNSYSGRDPRGATMLAETLSPRVASKATLPPYRLGSMAMAGASVPVAGTAASDGAATADGAAATDPAAALAKGATAYIDNVLAAVVKSAVAQRKERDDLTGAVLGGVRNIPWSTRCRIRSGGY